MNWPRWRGIKKVRVQGPRRNLLRNRNRWSRQRLRSWLRQGWTNLRAVLDDLEKIFFYTNRGGLCDRDKWRSSTSMGEMLDWIVYSDGRKTNNVKHRHNELAFVSGTEWWLHFDIILIIFIKRILMHINLFDKLICGTRYI